MNRRAFFGLFAGVAAALGFGRKAFADRISAEDLRYVNTTATSGTYLLLNRQVAKNYSPDLGQRASGFKVHRSYGGKFESVLGPSMMRAPDHK